MDKRKQACLKERPTARKRISFSIILIATRRMITIHSI